MNISNSTIFPIIFILRLFKFVYSLLRMNEYTINSDSGRLIHENSDGFPSSLNP